MYQQAARRPDCAKSKACSSTMTKIEYLVDNLYSLQPPPDRRWAGRCCAWPSATRSAARISSISYVGRELDDGWLPEVAKSRQEMDRLRHRRGLIRSSASAPKIGRYRRRPRECRSRRVPPHRQYGAEGRARGADRQEGNGRGEPAAGDLDRQEIYQSRAAIPRSDPGRQYRADEGGRQVRIPPRLQVQHLCDLVD